MVKNIVRFHILRFFKQRWSKTLSHPINANDNHKSKMAASNLFTIHNNNFPSTVSADSSTLFIESNRKSIRTYYKHSYRLPVVEFKGGVHSTPTETDPNQQQSKVFRTQNTDYNWIGSGLVKIAVSTTELSLMSSSTVQGVELAPTDLILVNEGGGGLYGYDNTDDTDTYSLYVWGGDAANNLVRPDFADSADKIRNGIVKVSSGMYAGRICRLSNNDLTDVDSQEWVEASVKLVITENIDNPLDKLKDYDGLDSGDRVLLTNQDKKVDDGIYIVDVQVSGAYTSMGPLDNSVGTNIYVTHGEFGGKTYRLDSVSTSGADASDQDWKEETDPSKLISYDHRNLTGAYEIRGIEVSPSSTYRMSVWARMARTKEETVTDSKLLFNKHGRILCGNTCDNAGAEFEPLDGGDASKWQSGWRFVPPINEWCLLVWYVHTHETTLADSQSMGGCFGSDGKRLSMFNDLKSKDVETLNPSLAKFPETRPGLSTKMKFFYYGSRDTTDSYSVSFYNPRMDEIPNITAAETLTAVDSLAYDTDAFLLPQPVDPSLVELLQGEPIYHPSI